MAKINATGLPIANPNMCIGGNFDTNPWQRGTTIGNLSDNQYIADRWIHNLSGTVVCTGDKIAAAPTVTQAGIYVQNCMEIGVSTADTSFSGTQYASISYLMEGYDFAQLAGGAVTVSFWVYATVTGTYCLAIRNSGADRNYIVEYTVDSTNTWEFKTVVFPDKATDAGGTWDWTTGVGAEFKWTLAGGTSWNATAGTWNTTDDFKTTNQVNACNNTSNLFRLALVKIEAGNVATPFNVETRAEVLEKCRRYYQSFQVQINNTATLDNAYSGAPMRAAPTSLTVTEDIGSGATFTEVQLGTPVDVYNFGIVQDGASDTQNTGTVTVDCELIEP